MPAPTGSIFQPVTTDHENAVPDDCQADSKPMFSSAEYVTDLSSLREKAAQQNNECMIQLIGELKSLVILSAA